jgi:excisionase family DNA binding protein
MITRLLTVAEVAHILGVSKGTAYALIRQMAYTQIGKKLLVSEQALEKYIREHSIQSVENKT